METLPPTNNFISNKYGYKLHFREFINPSFKETIFYFHGFNSSSNKKYINNFANYIYSMNINFLTLDFQSHGYSQGIPSLIENHEDLIDDAIQFINNRTQKYNFQKIGIIGSSMGGAVVSQILDKFDERIIGAILLAPCFSVCERNKYLEYLLHNFFTKYFPKKSIPKFLCSGVKPKDCLKEIPNNFTTIENLPFKTAQSIIKLADTSLQSNYHNKKIFIIHDPQDKITSFNGSKKFVELNKNVSLIPLDGSLHNILYNSPDVVLIFIIKLFF